MFWVREGAGPVIDMSLNSVHVNAETCTHQIQISQYVNNTVVLTVQEAKGGSLEAEGGIINAKLSHTTRTALRGLQQDSDDDEPNNDPPEEDNASFAVPVAEPVLVSDGSSAEEPPAEPDTANAAAPAASVEATELPADAEYEFEEDDVVTVSAAASPGSEVLEGGAHQPSTARYP